MLYGDESTTLMMQIYEKIGNVYQASNQNALGVMLSLGNLPYNPKR